MFYGFQYNTCGTHGEKGAIVDDSLFSVAENHVSDEGASVAWSVGKYVFEIAVLVAGNINVAMTVVNAWVGSFDRHGCLCALAILTDNVPAHSEREKLLEMELVFNDKQMRHRLFLLLHHANANAKLVVALRTLEDKLLAFSVFRFVEGQSLITFWAA